jgi:hypothetical protein
MPREPGPVCADLEDFEEFVDGRNRIRLTNGFRRFDIRMFGTRRLVGVLGNALLIRRVCRQLSFALIDIIEIFEFVLPNCKLWLIYRL